MITPESKYLVCEGRELHYMDWNPGNANAAGRVAIAWHGLLRTGRDMDELAGFLAGHGWRVICPDTIGRGLSQWSPDPDNEYQYPFYVKLALSLADQLGLAKFDWVGTSMGGAIGMAAASSLLKDRIQRLVLNDIGGEVADAAFQRISTYGGSAPAFNTVSELEAMFRTVYKPYGWLSDAEWRRLTESSTRRLPDGRVTPHYDPALMRVFAARPQDAKMWGIYEGVTVPTFLLRGEVSDLLLPETVEKMRTTGPGKLGLLQVLEVPGCGHAPALNVPGQLEPILKFLLQ